MNAALHGWQVIFLFLGPLTPAVGISFWFIMPDIISPQTFQSKDAPRYLPAKISIVILNKQRDEEKSAKGGE
ncbi:Allantoate permease [Ascochyta rabiei]|uniref:Transmembrane transport n=1 Tax=Didymella rabiei TaxID=5454 RepID=A0A162YK57_DIDRA|nr:Allantoate permease [Ascochyta rabiei]KZM20092.1 transmembrane transport [Ascochyta rabiei]UPX17154.1 Allantoate permease [Ascochyta rabiei]